jgi:hypothetical protein
LPHRKSHFPALPQVNHSAEHTFKETVISCSLNYATHRTNSSADLVKNAAKEEE